MTPLNPEAPLVALIDRVALADEKALCELYELTSSKLYGVAMRVVTNREWAEDVLQEAFINIWKIAGDYKATLSPPMAWMALVVRSRGLDFLRRRASERADRMQALHNCLNQLDNKQREVVSLAYMRDMSHGELAEQLKLPLGTVKTWIRRGLEQLRGCMAKLA